MTAEFKGRREDFRLISGRGRFTSDWTFPDQTYACFLRADRAHAAVLSVEIEEALRSPGVLAVLTGKDTKAAGFRAVPQLVRYPGKGGLPIKIPHREVLAETRVRYIGQEVALVVAASESQAQDAVEKIVVAYQDLPPVVDAEAALLPGAPELYPDEVPHNLSFEYEYGDADKTREAFGRAAQITRLNLTAQRLVGTPMEPKAAIASYDAQTGVYDLYAPSQGMTLMSDSLSGGTGIPESKIRVHAHDVGGGFGVRSEGYSEYCALMLAAKLVGRPVKWTGSRSETMVSDYHGRDAKMTGELALDADGHFLAMRILWIVNCGGYLSGAGPLINTLPPAGHSVNLYKIPHVHGLHRLALTNTTPTSAYRGAARPNVSYLAERLVDEAAREMGLDRVELRRRNLIRKEEFPYKTPPLGFEYDSGDPVGLLDAALEHADWSGYPSRLAQSKARGRLRGIGLAAFVEPAGGGGSPKEEVAIKFGESGNPILYSVSGPSGQGHETTYPEIVAKVFGIPADAIVHHASDPDGPRLRGDGTIGSRSTMSQGVGLYLAATEVVRKGKELAAERLEAAPTDLEFENGRYLVRGTDLSVSLVELAQTYARLDGNALDTLIGAPQGRAFPSGVHVAEVEIDPETGAIEIANYVAVDDCGSIINHTLVNGQLHGGIVQGLGQAIAEQCVYDLTSGQLITGSFMDYEMPRADSMGDIKLVDHGVPSPNNPLGVKGVGEAGATGSVPAFANAVIDALRPLGLNSLDTPYTPHRLWQAIRSSKLA